MFDGRQKAIRERNVVRDCLRVEVGLKREIGRV